VKARLLANRMVMILIDVSIAVVGITGSVRRNGLFYGG